MTDCGSTTTSRILTTLRRRERRLKQQQQLLRAKLGFKIYTSPFEVSRIMKVVETFGAISISDLSRFTALDRAQISRTAENLGKQGLVTFSADPNSKRKKLVKLSVEGRRILDEVRPKFADRQKHLKEQIGQEDENALWRGLSKLGEVLGT